MTRGSRLGKLLVATLISVVPTVVEASGIRGKVTCRGMRDNGNVVVYLDRQTDRPEEQFSPPSQDAIMDQLKLTFVPHILPILKRARVAFPNSDEVRHNVFSPSKVKRFNLGTYPKGVVKHVVFDQPGAVALLCNVHAEMSAYIIVTPTPYFALTDKEGRYAISDVPAGEYLLKAWHEKLSPLTQKVVVDKDRLTVVDLEMKK